MRSILLPALFLFAGATNAQPVRGLAWAWISVQGTTPAVGASYVYNSAGGAVSVSRASAGDYRVEFADLGTGGGIAHATAYGGDHHCTIHGWLPVASAQAVRVTCYNAGGAPTDGSFTVFFHKEARTGTAWTNGYLWANGECPDLR